MFVPSEFQCDSGHDMIGWATVARGMTAAGRRGLILE